MIKLSAVVLSVIVLLFSVVAEACVRGAQAAAWATMEPAPALEALAWRQGIITLATETAG